MQKAKLYESTDYVELMKKVREEFGDGALILSNRTIRKGLFRKKVYEVLACPPEKKEEVKLPPDLLRKQDLDGVKRMLREVSIKIENNSAKRALPADFRRILERLKRNGLEDDLVDEFVREISRESSREDLENEEYIVEYGKEYFQKLFQSPKALESEPGKTKAVVFVGPTGVGKTTTTTKMAVIFSVHEKKQVGLATVDVYRIGGVEQIKIVSEWASIPIEVAYHGEDLKKIAEKYSDKEFMFIDTSGRSQYNFAEIKKLQSLLEKSGVDLSEIFLVMSANSKYMDMLDTYEAFKALGVTSVLFTKMDETRAYGNIVSFLSKVRDIPVSYVTFGQTVPDDIKLIDGGEIVSSLFEYSSNY